FAVRVRQVWVCVQRVFLPVCFFFFFSSRRRHTRFSRDWSSDVCSSDLGIVRTLFSMMSPLAALYQTLITMAVIAWYLSVFFPMYYWLGPRFVQVGMIVFFISLFTAAPIVANMAVRHDFWGRSEEHTSELHSREKLVRRLL